MTNGRAAQSHVEKEKRYEDGRGNQNNMEGRNVMEKKLKYNHVIQIHVQVCDNYFICLPIKRHKDNDKN